MRKSLSRSSFPGGDRLGQRVLIAVPEPDFVPERDGVLDELPHVRGPALGGVVSYLALA